MDSSFVGLFFLMAVARFTWQIPGEVPPMDHAHDYATGKLHERMVLADGSPCNAEFQTTLEEILFDMEEHHNGSVELATTLRTKFEDLMAKNSDENSCSKGSWCDAKACKERVLIRIYSKIEYSAELQANTIGAKTEANRNTGNLTATPSIILILTIAFLRKTKHPAR